MLCFVLSRESGQNQLCMYFVWHFHARQLTALWVSFILFSDTPSLRVYIYMANSYQPIVVGMELLITGKKGGKITSKFRPGHQLFRELWMKSKQVVRNVKTGRLPVLPMEVQVIYRSSHFWRPTVLRMVHNALTVFQPSSIRPYMYWLPSQITLLHGSKAALTVCWTHTMHGFLSSNPPGGQVNSAGDRGSFFNNRIIFPCRWNSWHSVILSLVHAD